MIKGAARALHEAALSVYLKAQLRPAPLAAGVRVTYAGALPAEGAFASGGAVKLVKLAQKFPESGSQANVLYLVSSALPKGAVAWARGMKAAGGKVVLNQNGVAFPAWLGEPELSRLNIRNHELLDLADFIFFQSEFCKASTLRWVGTTASPNSVLPNPVEIAPAPAKAGTSASSDPLIVIAGSHHHPERVLEALKTLEILRRQLPARLRIAGKFRWEGAAEQVDLAIKMLGLQGAVEITGPFAQKDLASVYGGAKVLLHLQDKDASPTVPLEAMGFGLPVVGPRSGALPELVPADCGRLLEVPEDWDAYHLPAAKALAEAVRPFLDPSSPAPAACRQWVQKFSLDRWLSRHAEVLAFLAQGENRP